MKMTRDLVQLVQYSSDSATGWTIVVRLPAAQDFSLRHNIQTR
jgi:hypothetical protein